MSTSQLKSEFLNNTLGAKQKEVLRLEEKYMGELKGLLEGSHFQTNLLFMEEYLYDASNSGHLVDWGKTPIDDTLEEIFKFSILSEWKDKIFSIYPNPKAGDIGLIMEDCILSIDCKTLSAWGNQGDFSDLIFSSNQTSFKNKNYGGFEFKANLPRKEYIKAFDKEFPVLSFFVGVHYSYQSENSKEGLKLYEDEKYEVITLTCMPNGQLEDLFNRDLIYNVKFFDELTAEEKKQRKVKTLKFLSAKDYALREQAGEKLPHLNLDGKKDLEKMLHQYLPNFSYDSIFEHTKNRYGLINNGQAYKPAKSTSGGKSASIILKPCEPSEPRILKETLRVRWDENDNKWLGYINIKLDRK